MQDTSGKIKAVIFDFDGTIADSFEIFLESLQEVLKRPKPLTPDEIAELRGSSIREIINKLKVKKWQLPTLVIKGRRTVARKMGRVEVFSGMPDTISKLNQSNYKLFILSTNDKNAVDDFLRRYKLEDYFNGTFAGTSIFGKAKRLKSLLANEDLVANRCIYIGDETRDVEAAKEAGMKCIAVEWGYSAPETLKSYNPDIIASNPSDLVAAVKSLNS